MPPRPLFVAATRQHTGKTTVSLALMSGLLKRYSKVGFSKPVGQQHVSVKEGGVDTRVDKDSQLIKDYFELDHISYHDTSPVLVPRDYTKQYIDGEISSAEQSAKMTDAFQRVSASSDCVLLEGTGHVGVGSIIGMSNAGVAAHLGADMLLVANGGIGSAFDDLEINRIMCEEQGVRIRGVVLNKVVPSKVEMVRDYFGRAIQERWGVPLLGVVPDLPFLGKATLGDIQSTVLPKAQLIAGHKFSNLHYGVDDVNAVTTGIRRFMRRTVRPALLPCVACGRLRVPDPRPTPTGPSPRRAPWRLAPRRAAAVSVLACPVHRELLLRLRVAA